MDGDEIMIKDIEIFLKKHDIKNPNENVLNYLEECYEKFDTDDNPEHRHPVLEDYVNFYTLDTLRTD